MGDRRAKLIEIDRFHHADDRYQYDIFERINPLGLSTFEIIERKGDRRRIVRKLKIAEEVIAEWRRGDFIAWAKRPRSKK
jgi:hypothetical protein